MHRLLVAFLLAATPAVPASAQPAACVTAGFPVCAGTCRPGDVLSVTVAGGGTGQVSCGGATASCHADLGSCTATTRALSSGGLTCTLTGGTGVAYCDATLEGN